MKAERDYFAWLDTNVPGASPLGRGRESARKTADVPGVPAVPGTFDWDCDDWRIFFDERVGIAQFDGKVPQNIAEARAYQSCIVEWLNRHPVAPPPDRCAACGKEDAPGASIVPVGTGPHVWLHPECWREWHRARIAAAEAELIRIGLGARGLR